jgi:pimeloyl-ACP methyl ester carboxylesterase
VPGQRLEKQIFLEAHVPQPGLAASLLGIPCLVTRGSEDALIDSSAAMRTAIYHNADYVIAEGMGHLLHFEPGAERVAQLVLDWIARKRL